MSPVSETPKMASAEGLAKMNRSSSSTIPTPSPACSTSVRNFSSLSLSARSIFFCSVTSRATLRILLTSPFSRSGIAWISKSLSEPSGVCTRITRFLTSSPPLSRSAISCSSFGSSPAKNSRMFFSLICSYESPCSSRRALFAIRMFPSVSVT